MSMLVQMSVSVEVVISTLGSAGAARPDIAATGADRLVTVMCDVGPQRLLTVTGSGVRLPGEPLTPAHAAKRHGMERGAPQLLADGDRHLATIAASTLDWTTLRVPFMTNENSGAYTISSAAPHPQATVRYRGAARAVTDLISDRSWSGTAPFSPPHPRLPLLRSTSIP